MAPRRLFFITGALLVIFPGVPFRAKNKLLVCVLLATLLLGTGRVDTARLDLAHAGHRQTSGELTVLGIKENDARMTESRTQIA